MPVVAKDLLLEIMMDQAQAKAAKPRRKPLPDPARLSELRVAF